MTQVGDDTQPAMSYPNSEQYEQWKARAEQRGYNSTSRFMIDMVEAGSKMMDISVDPDRDVAELRKQRNDLKELLNKKRQRVEHLEEQLYHSEKQEIVDFVEDQPEAATFGAIVQHLVDDTPARVAQYLGEMEGQEVTLDDDSYRVIEESKDGD